MSTDTTIVKPTPPLFDEARLAVAGFLASYSDATRASYATDLRQYLAWCAGHDLEVFAARRGHIELYARTMERRGLARSTIGRRLSTVAGFYRFAVIDGAIETSPPSTSAGPRSTPSRPRAGQRAAAARAERPAPQPAGRHPYRRPPGKRAGANKHISPHSLRHSFITAALDAGVPLRDVQIAARHAHPRTTTCYDRARNRLDRHASYIVTASSPVPHEARQGPRRLCPQLATVRRR